MIRSFTTIQKCAFGFALLFLFVYSLDYVPGIMDSNGKMFGLFSMTTFVDIGHHATYGFEDPTTRAWIEFSPSDNTDTVVPPTSFKVLRDLGNHQAIVQIPRYQEFTTTAQDLIHNGARFHQIAGNELIVVTAISPVSWTNHIPNLQLLRAQPLLTNPGNTRNVLLCRVNELHAILPMLENQGLKIEHIYDY